MSKDLLYFLSGLDDIIVEPPVFNPLTEEDLIFWFDSDYGVVNASDGTGSQLSVDDSEVGSWLDRTDTFRFSQANSVNKPRYMIDWINSVKNAVRVAPGTTRYMTLASPSPPYTIDYSFTMYIVYSNTSVTDSTLETIFGSGNQAFYAGGNAAPVVGFGIAGASNQREALNNEPTGVNILTFQNSKLFLNGTEVSAYNHTGTIASVAITDLFRRPTNAFIGTMSLAHMILCNTSHNQAKIDQYITYLNNDIGA